MSLSAVLVSLLLVATDTPLAEAATIVGPDASASEAAMELPAPPGAVGPEEYVDEAVAEIPNPAIDMPRFLSVAEAAAEHRLSRRISEEDFLRMAAEPGTIVLDARSAQRYAQLHVKGAINLSFPDITVESLATLIPDKETRILIYCNNNFTGAPEPFPTKMASASLNLSTYVSLYDYGYRNVYELGPLVDVKESKLTFEGSAMEALELANGDA
ncbi:rhodanese-like domain-containing protein [Arenimonas sp.]|uniref:rhodanese-like domain-containing protein n=1 Tax=Arenimonas sp. TaxID=1872635 RepID=UPI0039E26F89